MTEIIAEVKSFVKQYGSLRTVDDIPFEPYGEIDCDAKGGLRQTY